MNTQQLADLTLRSAGFVVPTYTGSSDLENDYRVGRHDLNVTVDFDFTDMVVRAACEDWDFEVQDRFETGEDILAWIEVQKQALNDLIDSD